MMLTANRAWASEPIPPSGQSSFKKNSKILSLKKKLKVSPNTYIIFFFNEVFSDVYVVHDALSQITCFPERVMRTDRVKWLKG